MLNRNQLSSNIVDYSGVADATQLHTIIATEIAALRDVSAPNEPADLFIGATGSIELSLDGSNVVSIEPVSTTSNASTSFLIHNNRPIEILPDDANKTVKISDLVIRRVPDASYITSTYNVEIGRNLKVRGSETVEGDMLINGGFLSSSLAILRNFTANQIGYQFKINDDNLLELIKYENNTTKRMMSFGKGDVFGSNDISAFPTITEEAISSGSGSVFKLNSGGAWVFIEGVDKLYADLQKVGIGTSNPNPLATLEVIGNVITSGALFINGVQQISDSQDWTTKISSGAFPSLPMTSNVSTFEDTFYGMGTHTASSSSSSEQPYLAFDQAAATQWSSTTSYTDETVRIFPPANMTAPTTAYTAPSVNYGIGSFIATASTTFSGAGWEPWRAFAGGLWHTASSTYGSGFYVGSQTTLGYSGEWLQLQSPVPIQITTFEMYARTGYEYRAPGNFRIFGSMDGATWTLLSQHSGVTWPTAATQTFTATENVTQYFTFIRLAVNRLEGAGDSIQVGMKYYGQHQYAPYANSLYYPLGTFTTPVGASTYRGEWLQVQLPQPVQVTSYTIRSAADANRAPKAWYMLASSDGTTWSQIGSQTGQSMNANTDYTYSATSALFYNYFRLVVTEIKGTINNHVSIASLILTGNYFGSENPTFTLPPFAMSAPTTVFTNYDVSSGSYTASASTTSGTDAAWKAFDGIDNTSTSWTGASGTYDVAGEYIGAQSTVASNEITYAGEWIQLAMPQEVILSGYRISVPTGLSARGPNAFVVLGSLNGSTWDLVDQRTELTWGESPSQLFTFSPKATSYTFYRIVFLRKTASITDTNLSLGAITLRGTVPSIKMPPAALTANSTTITGYGGADGEYVVSASSEYSANEGAWRVGDGDTLGTMWTSSTNTLYNASGAYVGTVSTTASNGTIYRGEWVQYRFPKPVLLTKYILGGWTNAPQRAPENFVILGSNDGTTWSLVDQRTGVVWNANNSIYTFALETLPTVTYSYYRMVALKKIANADTWLSIGRWHIYGPLDYVNLFIQNYNIGINTAQPQSLLDVRGVTRVGGHILPRSNVTYDLGTSNLKFRDLFLSGNTIDMEDTTISVSSNNQDIEVKSRTSGALKALRVDDVTISGVVMGKGSGTTLSIGNATNSIGSLVSVGSNVGIQKQNPGTGLPSAISSLTLAPSIRPIVNAIGCGYDHTLLLMSDGSVRAFGANNVGQLGDGTTTQRLQWVTPIGMSSGVKSVHASIQSSYAVMQDGSLRAWGRNSESQLGDGTTTARTQWVQPQNMGRNVVKLSTMMGYHWAALMSDSSVWACGYNNNGQLGDGTTTNRSTPVRMLENGAADVACGLEHTNILMSNGTIRSCGRNAEGMLGDGTTTRSLTLVQALNITTATAISVGEQHVIAKLADGTWRAWGYNFRSQLADGTLTNRSTPVTITLSKPATQIVCGGYHNIVHYTDGTIATIGYNVEGQLGNNTTGTTTTTWQIPAGLADTAVSEVVASNYTTFVRLTDNTLIAFGWNTSGQLGNGFTSNLSVYTTVIPAVPTTLRASTLFTRSQRAIAGGISHSMVVTSTGRLLVSGFNRYGQLGNNTTVQRLTWITPQGFMSGVLAVACGFYHSVVLMTDGSVRTFGLNNYGQLGDGTTTQRNTFIVPTGLSSGCVAIAANGYHTAVVMQDGSMRTFGWNGNGQLGDGTTTTRLTPLTPTNLGPGSGIVAVACGEFHTIALLSNGTLRAFGRNTFGQLGTGTTTDHTTAVVPSGLTASVVSISAGSQHTAVLLSDGTLRSCGLNLAGQLGRAATATASTTTWVEPAEMGATLTIREIACGNMNTYMLMSDNTMRVLGFGGSGSLASHSLNEGGGINVSVFGVGDWWQVNSNVNLATGIPVEKTTQNIFKATAPLLVSFRWVNNADIALLRVANSSSGPILYDHSAPNPITTTVMIQPGQFFAFRSGGGIGYNWHFQWNANNNGIWQVPLNITGNVQTLGCGAFHAMSLMEDGTLRGWGNNTYGQLANNSTYTTSTTWVQPIGFDQTLQATGSWLDVVGNLNISPSLSTAQIYPQSAMSSTTLTTASQTSYAANIYIAKASSVLAGSPYNDPWRAFDKNNSTYWHIADENLYDQATGAYVGSSATAVLNTVTNTSTTYMGEWLQLEMATPIQFSHYNIIAGVSYQYKYIGEVDLGGTTGPYSVTWTQVEAALGSLTNTTFTLFTLLRNSSVQEKANSVIFDQGSLNASGGFDILSVPSTNTSFMNILTVQNTNGVYTLLSEQRIGHAKSVPFVNSTGAYAYSPWGDSSVYKFTFYGKFNPPTSDQAPNAWVIAGSTTGSGAWKLLDNRSSITFTGSTSQTFIPSTTNSELINYIRLICLSKKGNTRDRHLAIGAFDVYGRERLSVAGNGTFNLQTTQMQTQYSNVIYSSNDHISIRNAAPSNLLEVGSNLMSVSAPDKRVSFGAGTRTYRQKATVEWVTKVDGTGDDYYRDVTTDSQENVIVVGQYTAAVTVFNADGTSAGTLTNSGSSDGMIVKYNSAGQALWWARVSASSQDETCTVAVDANDNIYVSGVGSGTFSFVSSNNTTPFTLTSAGSLCGYIAKMNPQGIFQWVARIDGTGQDRIDGIAVDPVGNIYVEGHSTSNPLTFYNANGASARSLALSGWGWFITKYDNAGTNLWATRIDGSGDDAGRYIACNAAGEVYTFGRFASNPVTFYNADGTTATTQSVPQGSYCASVAKYSTNGMFQWACRIDSTSTEECLGGCVDSQGNVYTSGYCTTGPTQAFNADGTIGYILPAVTGNAVFLFKLSSTGSILWGTRMESSGNDISWKVKVDKFGYPYATGYNQNAVTTFFNKDNVAAYYMPAPVGYGSWVAKYDPDGYFIWAAYQDGNETDEGRAVTIDSLGAVYVAGYMRGSGRIYNSDNTLATTITFSTGNSAMLVKYAQDTLAQAHFTVQAANSVAPISLVFNNSNQLAVNKKDAYYALDVTGTIRSSTINPGSLIVADGNSVLVNSSNISSDLTGYLTGVRSNIQQELDLDLNVFDSNLAGPLTVTGYLAVQGQQTHTNVQQWDLGTRILTLNSQSNNFKGYLTKNSTPTWLARVDGTGAQIGYGVATDLQGNVYACGSTATGGTSIFNHDGTQASTYTTIGTAAFIVKYTTTGMVDWQTRIDGAGNESSTDMVCDGNSDLIVVGVRGGDDTIFYHANGTSAFTMTGTNGHYIAKYRGTDGTLLWCKRIDKSSESQTTNCVVSTDKSLGLITICGSSFNTAITVFVNNSNSSTGSTVIGGFTLWGIYVLTIDTNGQIQWTTRIDGTSSDQILTTYSDKGSLFITGSFESTPLNIYTPNQSSVIAHSISTGVGGHFLCKLSSLSGEFVWNIRSPTSIVLRNVVCDSSSNVYVAASWSGSNTSLTHSSSNYATNIVTFTSPFGWTAVLLKLDPTGTSLRWMSRVDGTGDEHPARVVIDNKDCLTMIGYDSTALVIDSSRSSVPTYGLNWVAYSGYWSFSSAFASGSTTRTDSTFNATGGAIGQNSRDNFSIQWTGYFMPSVTGVWDFGTSSDDRSEVYIDDMTAYISWTTWYIGFTSGSRYLQAGQLYQVKILYGDSNGPDGFGFYFRPPGYTNFTPDLRGYFFRSINDAQNTAGAYPMLPSDGGTGVFAVNFDSFGTFRWAIRADGTAGDTPNSVAITSENYVAIVGGTNSAPLKVFDQYYNKIADIPNSGSTNAFIIRYVPDDPILLNASSNLTPPASNLVSGFEITRGDVPDYQFVYTESKEAFEVGTVGNLQVVATRDRDLKHRNILSWNTNSLAYTQNVELDQGSNLNIGRERGTSTVAAWDAVGLHSLSSNAAVFPTHSVAFPGTGGSLAIVNGWLALPRRQFVDQNWWASGYDFTIETWINVTNRTNTGYIIQHGNGQGNIDWGLGILANGTANVYTWNGSAASNVTGTTVLPLGQWHHIAFTWHHTTQTICLYVNGVQEAISYRVGVPYNWEATTTLTIGHHTTFTYYINGLHFSRGLLYMDNFTPSRTLPTPTSESLFLLEAGDQQLNGRIVVPGNMMTNDIRTVQPPSHLLVNAYAERANPLTAFGNPVVVLDANTSTSAFTNSASNHPIFEPNGKYWRFTRTSSQFINFGTKTFTIADTGFSAVVVVRMTGTPGNYERIYDFANANGDFIFDFSREATNNNVYAGIVAGQTYSDANWRYALATNVLQADLIRVYGVTISNTGAIQVYVNGKLAASAQAVSAPVNRTVSNTYIGATSVGISAYPNMDVFHLSTYNATMTAADMQDIYKYMSLETARNLNETKTIPEKYGFSLGSLTHPWNTAFVSDGLQLSNIELVQDTNTLQWRPQTVESGGDLVTLQTRNMMLGPESMPIVTVPTPTQVKTITLSNNIPIYSPIPNIYQNSALSSNLTLSSNVQTINNLVYRAAASSSNTASNAPFCAFDGDSQTEWVCANNTSNNCWVEYAFPAPTVLLGYNLVGSTTDATRCPNTWNMQGSLDGVYYENLDFRSNEVFVVNTKLATYILSAGAGGAGGTGDNPGGGGAGGVVVTRLGSTINPSPAAGGGGGANGGQGGGGGAGFGAGGGGGGLWYAVSWLNGGPGARGFVFVIGSNDEVFATTNQSYTITQTGPLRVLLMGGGGGGGNQQTSGNRSGGGGGYLTQVTLPQVVSGTVLSITVGTGGNENVNGTASSIIINGVTYTANGGQTGGATSAGGAGSSQGGASRVTGSSGGAGTTGMGTTAFNAALSAVARIPLNVEENRKHYTVNNLAMYRIYRMYITRNNGNTTVTSVADLNLLTTQELMAGHIGIGVPIPTVALDVSGSGAVSATEYVNLPRSSTSNQGIVALTNRVDMDSNDIAATTSCIKFLLDEAATTSNAIFTFYPKSTDTVPGIVQLKSSIYLDRWASKVVTPSTPSSYFAAPTVGSAAFPVFNVANSITFNRASSQYLDLGPMTINPNTTGFTLMARVRFDGTAGNFDRIFDCSGGVTNNGTNLIVLSRSGTTGAVWFEMRGANDANSNGYTVVSPNTAIVQGTPLTVAARYDPFTSGGTMTLWINGQLVGTTTNTSSKGALRSLSNIYIGRSTFTVDAYFNGIVYYAGIFNSVLTASDILEKHYELSNQNIAYDRLTSVTAVDLLNISFHLTHNISNIVDGDDVTYWNPIGLMGPGAVYKIQLTLADGASVAVDSIRIKTVANTTHDPTAFRAYADATKTQLLASFTGTMNTNSGVYIFDLATPYTGTGMYLEFDKSTSFQMLLPSVDLYTKRDTTTNTVAGSALNVYRLYQDLTLNSNAAYAQLTSNANFSAKGIMRLNSNIDVPDYAVGDLHLVAPLFSSNNLGWNDKGPLQLVPTIIGAPQKVAGPAVYGNALSLNNTPLTASSHHLQYNGLSLNREGPFTCAAWLQVNNSTALQTLLNVGSTTSENGFKFRVQTNQISLVLTTQNATGSATWDVDLRASMTVGTWFHAAVLFNGSSRSAQLYINGELAASGSTVNTALPLGNNTTLRIGNTIGLNQAANMAVADVRLYNRLLSAQELRDIVRPQWLAATASAVKTSYDYAQSLSNYGRDYLYLAQDASTSNAGLTRLSTSITSTASNVATTASTIKFINDISTIAYGVVLEQTTSLQFPPAALSVNGINDVSGAEYANGVYEIDASSFAPNKDIYLAFDGTATFSSNILTVSSNVNGITSNMEVVEEPTQWMSGTDFTSLTTNVGISNVTLGGGEWLQLAVPEMIVPNGYTFGGPKDPNNHPSQWYFLASSNEGDNWDVLDQRTLQETPASFALSEYEVSTTNMYNMFRLHVVSAIDPSGPVGLVNWALQGARTTLRADPSLTMLASVDQWQQDASNNSRFFFTSNAGTRYTSFDYEHTWLGSNGAFLAGIASNGDLTASNITAFSDARLKTNIQPITNALETTLQLRGVSFERFDHSRQVGFVAQEVEALLPQVIRHSPDGTLSIAYEKMIALLIESIKDLDDMLECKLQRRQNK
jgi:alpha-tubulin suppressor-like RCC1 family protein